MSDSSTLPDKYAGENTYRSESEAPRSPGLEPQSPGLELVPGTPDAGNLSDSERVQGLPDPQDLPTADVVIFDGECNFCISQVRKLKALDCCGGRLSFLSLHDPRVKERYPDLTYDQLMEQMYVVDGSGRRHGGADAVRYLTRRLPLLWIAMPILHFPGSAGLWRWMYRQVAKRRYQLAGKISGKTVCKDDACSVHFD